MLTLDFERLEAQLPDGRRVGLSPLEARLLARLLADPGQVVSLAARLDAAAPVRPLSTGTLRVAIHRLRRKLEPDPTRPRHLHTRRGEGYSLTSEPVQELGGLSPRQRQLLELAQRGATHNEIAIALGISSRTVGWHLRSIRDALGARTTPHALAVLSQASPERRVVGIVPADDLIPGAAGLIVVLGPP